jgi:hypothetical protein
METPDLDRSTVGIVPIYDAARGPVMVKGRRVAARAVGSRILFRASGSVGGVIRHRAVTGLC